MMDKIDKNRWVELRNRVGFKSGMIPRLNKQRLKVKDHGKEYAEVVFFGDTHWGSPQCDRDRARRMIQHCIDKNIYVLLMGDLIEFATRGSVGAGVYEQIMNPHQQFDEVMEMLTPLADKKLILGLLRGNHELRGYKESGIDIARIMATELDCRYLMDACWNLWYVGKQSYSIYSLHGATGSRYIYTKLNCAIKIAHNFASEILVMGHVHENAYTSTISQVLNKHTKTIEEMKHFVVLTGHYLNYDKSYAQRLGMGQGKLGSPKIKFFANKHDIHISC